MPPSCKVSPMSPAEKAVANRKTLKFEVLADMYELYATEIATVKAALTPEQQAAMPEVLFYRLLRAWDFDMDKVIEMTRNTADFRIENDMQGVRAKLEAGLASAEFPYRKEVTTCFQYCMSHGEDKEGQPLSVVFLGSINGAAMVRHLERKQICALFMYEMEDDFRRCWAQTERTGKLTRSARIIDLKGLSASLLNNQDAFAMLKGVLTMGQDHYPESLGVNYIVNPPLIFHLGWRLVSPWLRKSTLDKIVVLGSDYKEKLQEYIDVQYLPPSMGGSCPKCPSCLPPPDEKVGMEEVVVGARSVFSQEYVLTKNQVCCWKFFTIDKDIAFTHEFVNERQMITRKASSPRDRKRAESLSPKAAKVQSSGGCITGEYTATESGTLTLLWDNAYSMFTSKSLLYSVDVADTEGVQLPDQL